MEHFLSQLLFKRLKKYNAMNTKVSYEEFTVETGLIDDVLEAAWNDYIQAEMPEFWLWWANNQGKYV